MSPTLEEFTITTLIGAGAGAIGGKGANAGNLMGVVQTARQILKTAASPKKIAMYTSKIIGAQKNLVESVLRTVAAGILSNMANYKRKWFGSLVDQYLWR